MRVISRKIHQLMLLGSLPACMVAMVLFRDPSSDQPTHDMPGGANRFINRSRTISIPLPVAERGGRLYGTAYPENGFPVNGFFPRYQAYSLRCAEIFAVVQHLLTFRKITGNSRQFS